MADWLKNTIPGILILGTLGAILAIILTQWLAWLVQKWIRPARHSTLGLLASLIIEPKENARRVFESNDWKHFVLYGVSLVYLAILGMGLVGAGLSMLVVASVRSPTDGVKFFGVFGIICGAGGVSLVYWTTKGLRALREVFFEATTKEP